MDTTERDGRALAVRGAPGQAGEVRVGDGDRAAADRVLGEHVTAGRLSSTEYAERATQARTARVRSDITVLFGDLPAPHPRFGDPAVESAPAQRAPQPGPTTPSTTLSPQQTRRLRQAAVAVVAPCAIFGALAGLAFAAHSPEVLLVAMLTIGCVYGVLVLTDKHRRHGG